MTDKEEDYSLNRVEEADAENQQPPATERELI